MVVLGDVTKVVTRRVEGDVAGIGRPPPRGGGNLLDVASDTSV